MCEGSFLPSSFGPHQKHTEFESSLRSYPISSNVLCKLSKLHGTAEAMCNENRGFLTTSLEMDKRRRPTRSGLLQNVSQGRDRWGLAEGSTRQWPTVHLSDLGTWQIRQRIRAPDIKEAILRADRRPLQHTSPNQREGFDCSRHELVIDGPRFRP